jgi:HSP20 family protein
MRYRRLGYRYAVVLTAGEPRQLADYWRTGSVSVVIAQPCWRPAADLYETTNAIYVTVELAGVALEELEIVLYDDALVIEGKRRLEAIDSEGMYHTAEIRQGPFRLELPLPASVNPEQIESNYSQGILQLVLTKVNKE